MTSCADAAPSSGGAAETCRGPIQLTHAKTTINARSRQLTPPSGEDVLTRGVARLTRRRCGEMMWVKIPCQDCHRVRRIDLLLSCTLPLHRPSDLLLLRRAMRSSNPEPLPFPDASIQKV